MGQNDQFLDKFCSIFQ